MQKVQDEIYCKLVYWDGSLRVFHNTAILRKILKFNFSE